MMMKTRLIHDRDNVVREMARSAAEVELRTCLDPQAGARPSRASDHGGMAHGGARRENGPPPASREQLLRLLVRPSPPRPASILWSIRMGGGRSRGLLSGSLGAPISPLLRVDEHWHMVLDVVPRSSPRRTQSADGAQAVNGAPD